MIFGDVCIDCFNLSTPNLVNRTNLEIMSSISEETLSLFNCTAGHFAGVTLFLMSVLLFERVVRQYGIQKNAIRFELCLM